MKHMYHFLSFVIVLTCLVFSVVDVSADSCDLKDRSEKELRQYANENNTWVVCYQQGKRTSSFFQYDATTECIYFSYSKHSCVDVYDINGSFLYSFIFPDKQNGGMCVRCEGNQVYISTKDNVLYIFEGIEEVDRMDYDKAAEKGFDYYWFYDNNPHITVDNTWIRWRNNSGEVVKEIKTPTVIKQTIPSDSIKTNFILFVAAFIVFLFIIIRANSQKT